MKKIAFIFLFASTLFGAQNQRFYYDYKFVPDSTNKTDIKTEMMILDVTKSGSKYYSYEKFKSDSISKADVEKQVRSGSGNINIQRREGGSVNYSVTKTYPDFQVFLIKNISMDAYKIAEDAKPEWKIEPDKQKIGEYNTQKATTNFGGRNWIAWFSADIPLQEGPYKFHGLPGLIVKLEDTNQSHVMTLVGNKKEESRQDNDIELPGNAVSFGFNKKEIEVTEKQYKKIWEEYKKDPAKNMREMMMKNGGGNNLSIKIKTQDGKEMSDPNQIYREIEKRTKDLLMKNNNTIEPELMQ